MTPAKVIEYRLPFEAPPNSRVSAVPEGYLVEPPGEEPYFVRVVRDDFNVISALRQPIEDD